MGLLNFVGPLASVVSSYMRKQHICIFKFWERFSLFWFIHYFWECLSSHWFKGSFFIFFPPIKIKTTFGKTSICYILNDHLSSLFNGKNTYDSNEQNDLYLFNIDQEATQRYKKKKSRPFTNIINQCFKLLQLKTQSAEPKLSDKLKCLVEQLRDEL